ncbi:synaptotagmin-like protein 1 isoform X3 [Pseudoliparis swirei]|uniref:synaptotagmin-like protein 1 isoform X3 n=1 Tax=Pseudoliparis swirei TaxID=2059687 RepID=UPI0024BEDD6F|nr:synaptotagmin-like protein 1 isoform X3 [Pseudoliparis swirei]
MPTVPGIYKKKDSDYLQLAESPQVDDRRGSDTEIVSVNRISPQLRTPFQSSARADSISQSRETSAQAKLSDTIPVSPLETDPGSERLHLSQNSPYMTGKQGERQIPPKTQMRRGSSEDPLTMDKSTQSSMSLNEREATSIKERFNSPSTNRHGQPLPLSTAEKIKQLRSFWEKEWKKPPYNIDKLEPCVDGKVGRGANQSKMNYRFTKSEYDLTSLDTIGNDSGSDDKHSDVNYHNLSALPLSQSRDKLSPILRTSQTQFSTLREFWDEARSDTKGSSPFVKLKSPKMKEPISAQLSSQGLKWDDPENYCVPEKPRPAAAKSSPPLPNRSKLPRNRLTLSRVANDGTNNSSNYATVESKWSSKDPNREEKPPTFPSSLGKEIRSTKTRKDSFGRSSTRGNSMRRATSMFLLTDPEEKEREIDFSPVHSQSRKQRQNAERGAPPRRPAEETLTPRTRVYVPKDYRHYLGMTDETTSHNYLAPAVTDEGSGGQEARKDTTADMRRDVSSIPSTSSSLFSDQEHLKMMSKSVPSLLQKEDLGRDIDSTDEDSYRPGRLMTGSSLNNLTSSSGMSSLSSLSGSMMTMYSGDFGNVDVQGNIQFSINYIQKLREFHIFVTKCQGLAAVDPKRDRSDPYVKSYLVPDKANLGKRKTSVKKKTRNPTFNEILRYRVRMEYLRTQTLILSVWHHDTFGKNSFLGEVDVNLSKWNFDHTQMNYLALKARTPYTLAPSLGQGEMRLAIRFLPEIIHSEGLMKEGPNTGEVHIWVKECKNLPAIRATIDPYVKCFMLPDISRKSRQKTRVLRRTLDPAFNHTMVYDGIRQADLSEACVELIVWDQDRLASNLLGGLRLGVGKGKSYGEMVDWMDSTPYEAALWERMMTTPNEWVEDVLPLRVMNSSKTRLR